MTQELFTRILDDFQANFDLKELVVASSFAGESTLHPHFAGFSYQAAELGFKHFQLATNGTELTVENRRAILDCYTQVAVSIHNTPLLPKVIEDTLTLMREREGKTPHIRANIIEREFPAATLSGIRATLHGNLFYGVKGVDAIKPLPVITEDLKSTMSRLPHYPVCPNMYFYLAILWNGDCLPCCHLLSSGDWSLGNVAEKTVHEVFNGDAYNKLRLGFEEGTPCEGCEVRR